MPFSHLALPIAALSFSQRAAARLGEKTSQVPNEAAKPPNQVKSVNTAKPQNSPRLNHCNRLCDSLGIVKQSARDPKQGE
ncbi:hypothetical protein HRG_014946 [Hirsutella rhossiliensis]